MQRRTVHLPRRIPRTCSFCMAEGIEPHRLDDPSRRRRLTLGSSSCVHGPRPPNLHGTDLGERAGSLRVRLRTTLRPCRSVGGTPQVPDGIAESAGHEAIAEQIVANLRAWGRGDGSRGKERRASTIATCGCRLPDGSRGSLRIGEPAGRAGPTGRRARELEGDPGVRPESPQSLGRCREVQRRTGARASAHMLNG